MQIPLTRCATGGARRTGTSGVHVGRRFPPSARPPPSVPGRGSGEPAGSRPGYGKSGAALMPSGLRTLRPPPARLCPATASPAGRPAHLTPTSRIPVASLSARRASRFRGEAGPRGTQEGLSSGAGSSKRCLGLEPEAGPNLDSGGSPPHAVVGSGLASPLRSPLSEVWPAGRVFLKFLPSLP